MIKYTDVDVKSVKSVVCHYSYPQFAKRVLDSYEAKIQKVLSVIRHVYYFNIDALLIDEDDYYKLMQAGMIGDELGQFKIEHIFKMQDVCVMRSA